MSLNCSFKHSAARMRLRSLVNTDFFVPFQAFLDPGGMKKSAISYIAVSGAMMTSISTLASIGVELNKETSQLPHFRTVIYPDAIATNSVTSSVTVVLTSIHCKF